MSAWRISSGALWPCWGKQAIPMLAQMWSATGVEIEQHHRERAAGPSGSAPSRASWSVSASDERFGRPVSA
jgi:hypothetical protein